jgi:hypothetical protein
MLQSISNIYITKTEEGKISYKSRQFQLYKGILLNWNLSSANLKIIYTFPCDSVQIDVLVLMPVFVKV